VQNNHDIEDALRDLASFFVFKNIEKNE